MIRYLVEVNGLIFAESIEQSQLDYIMKKLANYPELKVKVHTVIVEGAKLA